MSQDKFPRNRLTWGFLYKWLFEDLFPGEPYKRVMKGEGRGRNWAKLWVLQESILSLIHGELQRVMTPELSFFKARGLGFCAHTSVTDWRPPPHEGSGGERGISQAFPGEVAPPADESLEKGQQWAIKSPAYSIQSGCTSIYYPWLSPPYPSGFLP